MCGEDSERLPCQLGPPDVDELLHPETGAVGTGFGVGVSRLNRRRRAQHALDHPREDLPVHRLGEVSTMLDSCA